VTTKTLFRKEDFMLPDGSLDHEMLRREFEAANIPLKDLQETAAKLAKKHGKSMNDVLVECIQSDELSESEKAEALKMLGQMPLSWYSDVTN
jgi:hypothetical protein